MRMKRLFLVAVCALLLLSPIGLFRADDSSSTTGGDYDDDDYEDEIEPSKPALSLNEQLNRTQLNELPTNIYISQFLSFMLTGSYTGNVTYNNASDEITVDGALSGGLQLLNGALADQSKCEPEKYTEIFADLDDIVLRLKENGTDSVTLGEVRKYITPQTIQAAVLTYIGLNAQTYNERFHKYLEDELFGSIQDPYCKLYATRWFDDIARANETWAFQMFDAMGKLPPGLSKANINWMGSYKVCSEVNNAKLNPPIKGRYCTAFIGFPLDQVAADLPVDDSIGLTYGMCVPDRCQKEDVARMVSNSLKLMSVFKYGWVNKVECDHEFPLPTVNIVFIVLLLIIIAFVLISTVYDVIDTMIDNFYTSHSDTSESIAEKNKIAGTNVLSATKKVVKHRTGFTQLLVDSSLYSNSLKFFRTDNGGKISCLNGIRFFSMVWIIFGHTFNYLGDRYKYILVDNIITMQELNNEWYAQLIINGMLAVDTFFLMSAFLLTISLMNKLEKSRYLTRFEWAYYYIHRYWRLLPPYMITLIIYTFVLPAIGKGPLFEPEDYPPNSDDCKNYWWAYMLMLNNFVPNGKGVKCMGYLWYIPNDYQFYALSPIFVILLYRYPTAGKVLIGTTITASMSILAFLTANVYVSRKKDIIFVLLDMWEDVYIKPYCRGAPWLVGIVLGYIVFKYKKVKLNYITVIFGWIMSTALALIAVFAGYTNHGKGLRRMETTEFAIFFSFSKLVWALSISWIIFACHHGYGGVVNSFLSIKTWIPLTRLSYCAYLIHPCIMTFINYSQGTLFHATGFTLVYAAVGHVFVSLFISFFYSMFFELPFIALEKVVYNPKH